jgi:hypothetical protein
MISDIVVLASVVLAAAFIGAWIVSPGFRAWIEQPKHRFQDAVRQYDVSQHGVDADADARARHPQEKRSS